MAVFKRNPDPRIKPPVGSVLNPDHPLARGLVGCWLMNEWSGDKIYNLGSGGHKNDGDVIASWSPEGLRFGGYIAQVDCGNLNVQGAFTVIALVSVFDTKTRNFYGSRAPSDYSFDAKFQNGTTIHSDIGDGSSWIDTSADADFNYELNTWYEVAYAVNQTGYNIYVNGVSIGSGSYASAVPLLSDANHTFFIGYNGTDSSNHFYGVVARTFVYNRALTPDEIAWLHAEPYCMILQPQYWYMVDFGTAGATYDVSLTLSHSLAVTSSGQATAEGSITLASAQAVSDGGQASAEGGLTLSKLLQLLQSANMTTEQSLTLPITEELSTTASADANANITLSQNQAITIQADAVGEASLSLAKTLALTLSGEVPGFEASLTLAQSLGLSVEGQSVAEAALALAHKLAIETVGQASGEAVLSLAMKQGLTTNYIIAIEASLDLAQTLGLSAEAQTIAEVQLSLEQILAISTLAKAMAEAGISLDQVVSLEMRGATVVAGLVTPDGRKFTVRMEVRRLAIEPEDRTLIIK